MSTTRTLEQFTPQEIADEAARLFVIYGPEGGRTEYFTWLHALRRECFERMASAMDPANALGEWVGQMIAQHGPRVRVFGVEYSWPAALGVVRYSEAPDHWPAAFDAEDVHRAKRWLYQGNIPEGVTYITVEG